VAIIVCPKCAKKHNVDLNTIKQNAYLGKSLRDVNHAIINFLLNLINSLIWKKSRKTQNPRSEKTFRTQALAPEKFVLL